MEIRKILLAMVVGSLASAGCVVDDMGDDDVEIGTTSEALATPQVLELINTCDQSAVRLFAGSNNKFVLDPGNGSQRFKGSLKGTKLACAVGVKFNVPAGHRARLGIATTFGKWSTSSFPHGAVFKNQAGFTTRRPLLPLDTQFGPSDIETEFLPKASTGTLDLQLNGNDEDNARLLVTECGAPNTWFYIRPAIDSAAASVDLSLILASFKLEPCP